MVDLVSEFGNKLIYKLLEFYETQSQIVLPTFSYYYDDICYEIGYKSETVDKAIKTAFLRRNTLSRTSSLTDLVIAAFQTKIAYNCVADNETAYNEALSNELGCSLSELQSYYSSSQEDIWINAKKLLEKYKLNLVIPKTKQGAYRYVQFPRSQQLFNLSDYQKYEQLFHKIQLQPNAIASFDEFKRRVFSRRGVFMLNTKYTSLDEKVLRRSRILKFAI